MSISYYPGRPISKCKSKVGKVTHGSIYALLTVLDEYRYFSSTRGFENFSELSYGLLQDLWRANVDFGDYD